MGFEPPGREARLKAIGGTEGLPEVLRKALDPEKGFEPIPVPKDGDWLAAHREAGQTFDAFVKSRPNRPNKSRGKIYLLPLGEFAEGEAPPVERLRDYAAAFFCMDVKILPGMALKESDITTRINQYTKKRQVLTGDVLSILKERLPDDAFCLLAITMEDLYPDPSWNFVFGQASLRERVGVYSFVRYDPGFYGQRLAEDYQKIVLRRSCKVLAHETAHMFGLAHCIYFRCALNGSNHLGESDARPMHLCPVCLHKLHHSISFDVVTRYRTLHKFCSAASFDDEAQWLARRLQWLGAASVEEPDSKTKSN